MTAGTFEQTTWSIGGGSPRCADSLRWQESLRRFYDKVRAGFHTGLRDRWTDYAYIRIKQRIADIVPPGSRVLDVGCGNGELLAHLQPDVGVGIDLNERVLHEAARTHPNLRFLSTRAEDIATIGETFDFIILSQVLDEIYDLRALFQALQSVCHSRTRIIVAIHSRVWQPVLRLMEWCRLKTPTPERNWLPHDEIIHLLGLCDFQTVRMFSMTIAPLYIPIVSAVLNKFFAQIPGFRWMGLNDVIIARSTRESVLAADRPQGVSIVVPARNEAGHIQQLLERLPMLAPQQEVIFVEGQSKDDTWEAIRRAAQDYRGPMIIKTLRQDGKGKGDAVRKGFHSATGDVLMILDADISVPPEELTAFYEALIRGQGEFINGSRMVYLMDKQAMRFLNLLGNKFFGWMFTYLLSQRFRDTLCGTKVLTRRDYERIVANRSYFGDFDPFGDFDLLFGAAKANLKIIDIPVHYKARTYGETNISRFQHGWMLLKMCFLAARKLKFV
jgi:ubiquinone/menaquinone biosynthesis C-methylase UbiE